MLRPQRALSLGALLALATAGACSGNPSPGAPSPHLADSTASPLAIRPGDVIKIQVWGHEDLSGEFPVDENYNLLFPIVGDINVRQLTVNQLRDRLRQELSQLLTRPFVTIVPLFRVAVMGEVERPGLYSVDPTLTIFDLLALAGGPRRAANERKMRLIRTGEQLQVALEPAALARATLRELGIRSGDQLIVPRRAITREDWGLLLSVANLVLISYTVLR